MISYDYFTRPCPGLGPQAGRRFHSSTVSSKEVVRWGWLLEGLRTSRPVLVYEWFKYTRPAILTMLVIWVDDDAARVSADWLHASLFPSYSPPFTILCCNAVVLPPPGATHLQPYQCPHAIV